MSGRGTVKRRQSMQGLFTGVHRADSSDSPSAVGTRAQQMQVQKQLQERLMNPQQQQQQQQEQQQQQLEQQQQQQQGVPAAPEKPARQEQGDEQQWQQGEENAQPETDGSAEKTEVRARYPLPEPTPEEEKPRDTDVARIIAMQSMIDAHKARLDLLSARATRLREFKEGKRKNLLPKQRRQRRRGGKGGDRGQEGASGEGGADPAKVATADGAADDMDGADTPTMEAGDVESNEMQRLLAEVAYLNKVRDERDVLRVDAREVRQAMAELRGRFQAKIVEYKHRMQVMEHTNSVLQRERQEIRARYDALEERYDTLEEKYETVRVQYETETPVALKERIDVLELELRKLRTQRGSLDLRLRRMGSITDNVTPNVNLGDIVDMLEDGKMILSGKIPGVHVPRKGATVGADADELNAILSDNDDDGDDDDYGFGDGDGGELSHAAPGVAAEAAAASTRRLLRRSESKQEKSMRHQNRTHRKGRQLWDRFLKFLNPTQLRLLGECLADRIAIPTRTAVKSTKETQTPPLTNTGGPLVAGGFHAPTAASVGSQVGPDVAHQRRHTVMPGAAGGPAARAAGAGAGGARHNARSVPIGAGRRASLDGRRQSAAANAGRRRIGSGATPGAIPAVGRPLMMATELSPPEDHGSTHRSPHATIEGAPSAPYAATGRRTRPRGPAPAVPRPGAAGMRGGAQPLRPEHGAPDPRGSGAREYTGAGMAASMDLAEDGSVVSSLGEGGVIPAPQLVGGPPSIRSDGASTGPAPRALRRPARQAPDGRRQPGAGRGRPGAARPVPRSVPVNSTSRPAPTSPLRSQVFGDKAAQQPREDGQLCVAFSVDGKTHDWIEFIDYSTGKPYYYHVHTKKTQWQPPPELKQFLSQLSDTSTPTQGVGNAPASGPIPGAATVARGGGPPAAPSLPDHTNREASTAANAPVPVEGGSGTNGAGPPHEEMAPSDRGAGSSVIRQPAAAASGPASQTQPPQAPPPRLQPAHPTRQPPQPPTAVAGANHTDSALQGARTHEVGRGTVRRQITMRKLTPGAGARARAESASANGVSNATPDIPSASGLVNYNYQPKAGGAAEPSSSSSNTNSEFY